MKQRRQWITLLAVITLLSACASSAALTKPTGSTVTNGPAQPALPTERPSWAAGVAACPRGYASHVEESMQFSACYPEGWSIARGEDGDASSIRLSFLAPAGSRGAGLRLISVSLSPALVLDSEEDFVHHVAQWMLQEYYRTLLSHPDIIRVDGRKAVDVGYDAPVVFGREVVEVTRWLTVFQVEDQQWTIQVTGRSQYRDELDEIRGHVLAHFHLLGLE